MDKLLYVPNPLLRQKADKIQSVGIKEKEIAKKMDVFSEENIRSLHAFSKEMLSIEGASFVFSFVHTY